MVSKQWAPPELINCIMDSLYRRNGCLFSIANIEDFPQRAIYIKQFAYQQTLLSYKDVS